MTEWTLWRNDSKENKKDEDDDEEGEWGGGDDRIQLVRLFDISNKNTNKCQGK